MEKSQNEILTGKQPPVQVKPSEVLKRDNSSEKRFTGKIKALLKKEKQRKPAGGRKKKKRIIAVCILIAVIAVGCVLGYGKLFGTPSAGAVQTAVASMGTVSSVIEGSGTIEAINQYEVTALVTGEILSDHFEEGQLLNKGDLMYTIDSTEMQNSIQKAQQSLEKAQLTYSQSAETLSNLNVYAGVSGVITELYVANGDQIQNGGKVAEIINTDYMLLKIQFNAADAQNLFVGESATVNLESSFTALHGEVSSIASGTLINGDGVPVTNVEIVVSNPGGVLPDERATAVVGGYACNAPGKFEYFEKETVTAETAGKVSGLNVHEGDAVKSGSRLITIQSDSAVNSARQSALSVQDAQISLQDQYDKLKDYTITAPISGKVIQKTAKAGEKLDNSTTKSAMAIIADLSTLVFEISVDELDISGIKEGQTVEITADALEGQTFTGYVENVSIVGTAQNGVTSYPVKVVVDNGEESGLIPGMNVNATIVLESRENVLTIPLSAVNRGNTVTVKKSGAGQKDRTDDEKADPSGGRPEGAPQMDKMPEGAPRMDKMPEGAAQQAKESGGKSGAARAAGNVPDGFETVRVEVGLSDDANVEIISGLSEGDIVLLPDKTTSSASGTQQSGMGAMGGMPGGMPGGSMPGGSMPGGSGGAPGGMRSR